MSQHHSDAAAPSIDRGVTARMRRLDPNLTVTWSEHALDIVTGNKIIARKGMDPVTGERHGGAVFSPRFYLWRRDDVSPALHYVADYPRFGHYEVRKLEGDLARFLSPTAIMRKMAEARATVSKRELASRAEYHKDKAAANESRINDLVFGGKDGRRAGKSFSYGGQKTRATPGDVSVNGREDGWTTE